MIKAAMIKAVDGVESSTYFGCTRNILTAPKLPLNGGNLIKNLKYT